MLMISTDTWGNSITRNHALPGPKRSRYSNLGNFAGRKTGNAHATLCVTLRRAASSCATLRHAAPLFVALRHAYHSTALYNIA